MQFKKWFIGIILMLFQIGFAQIKQYSFNEFNLNNQIESNKIEHRIATFSEQEINVITDKNFKLNIISSSHLPNKGTIYICNDEHNKKVTVMLIDAVRMYIYTEKNRYLIHFIAS